MYRLAHVLTLYTPCVGVGSTLNFVVGNTLQIGGLSSMFQIGVAYAIGILLAVVVSGECNRVFLARKLTVLVFIGLRTYVRWALQPCRDNLHGGVQGTPAAQGRPVNYLCRFGEFEILIQNFIQVRCCADFGKLCCVPVNLRPVGRLDTCA